MNQAELLLSYSTKGKSVKRVRITSRKYPFILGNSRKAHVSLNDAEISPMHTAIEYRNGSWYLLDLASETGTWIDNDIIAEFKIDKPTTFRMGPYVIKAEPRTHFNMLYATTEKTTGSDLHEVIVKNHKGILNTYLLPKNQAFQYEGGKTFKAPKAGTWESNEVENNVIIMQRLVKAPHELPKTKVEENLTSKKYIFSVLGVLCLVVATIVFFPRAPKDETEVKNLNTNRYTQLVFDSKLIQKKREEALKIDTFKAPVPSTKESSGVTESRQQAKAAPKVISNIKASGLQQLLGKIAQRQNVNNKNVVFSNGTTDYSKGVGAAIGGSKMPTVSGVSGGISNNEKGFKLSSVGTKGVGGGGNVTGYGTLRGGGAGSAEVGAVEDEAEIGSGLDRDAVAAVIRANIGQVRYCYERKLIANPTLYGKILVQFSIEGKGEVQRPKVLKTTLSDADVEGCILRRLSQWKFPTPPAGTSVLVTYPFLFKSTQ